MQLPFQAIQRLIDEAQAGHVGAQHALLDIEDPDWDNYDNYSYVSEIEDLPYAIPGFGE
jgi:hypothetical protein